MLGIRFGIGVQEDCLGRGSGLENRKRVRSQIRDWGKGEFFGTRIGIIEKRNSAQNEDLD